MSRGSNRILQNPWNCLFTTRNNYSVLE